MGASETQDVVTGMRRLFMTGSTYSGLLRFIKTRCGDQVHSSEIRRYFREAFHIEFLVPVRRDVTKRENDDAYALIDAWLVPDIISKSSDWIHPDDVCWWQSATENPVQQLDGKPRWLSETGWNKLSSREQDSIRIVSNSCSALERKVAIFARLAEQLQRNISEAPSTNH